MFSKNINVFVKIFIFVTTPLKVKVDKSVGNDKVRLVITTSMNTATARPSIFLQRVITSGQ